MAWKQMTNGEDKATDRMITRSRTPPCSTSTGNSWRSQCSASRLDWARRRLSYLRILQISSCQAPWFRFTERHSL